MYKNPQHSDQAKRLREELARFGAVLSHAQALEVTARIEGARTLHVAQAKNNAGVRIQDVARRQAQGLLFESMGRFEGNLEGLLEELKALGVLADAGDTWAVEAAHHKLLRQEDSPVVTPTYGDNLHAWELPGVFEVMVRQLTEVLQAAAKAPVEPAGADAPCCTQVRCSTGAYKKERAWVSCL